MPWEERSIVSSRREFVMLASQPGANRRALMRRFGVSPTTGYEWLKRYWQEGEAGLADRSRRPHHSPHRTAAGMEAEVVGLRRAQPSWGARKLKGRLEDKYGKGAGPAVSTITAILRRHDLLDPAESARHKPHQRFERAAPNELWQMDFKGHFATLGGRCHPLTALDDHSRYALVVEACADERGETVRDRLTAAFRRYGLPVEILMDRGSPWGSDRDHPYTPLIVWLLRLGVGFAHGRPYHPQTQGKIERFHRTLKAEAIGSGVFRDLAHCQQIFDAWRQVYNHERPHDALGLATPASRYRVSARPFPERLPAIDYGPAAIVRKVQQGGWISFHGRSLRLPKAFRGQPVALRPTLDDGVYDVVFCQQRIARLDLHHVERD